MTNDVNQMADDFGRLYAILIALDVKYGIKLEVKDITANYRPDETDPIDAYGRMIKDMLEVRRF